MSKDILMLGPAWPYRGGLASYNERLARAFMEAGHRVRIYTFTLQYPSFLFPGKTQFSTSPAPEGVSIERKVNSIYPVNWVKTGNAIREMKPDMLLVRYWLPLMGPCFGTIARRARKNRHTVALALLDNIIPHESRPGDRLFTRYFVRSMDGFMAQSRQVLEELNQFNTSRPSVFSPHPMFDNFGQPVDRLIAREGLGLDPKGKYLLFFGFVRRYKGLDLLLEAMLSDKLADPFLKLIIAGEYYEDREYYRKWLEHEKLRDRIIEFNQFIADEDVFKYFCAADLLVQPYRSATQSGVAQIAYHFELPMVVTDVGGLPEIVPDGKVGFVTRPDPEDIAEAIHRFFAGDYAESFRHNFREEKKRFTWDRMVKAFLALEQEARSTQ